jgi:hypothetical protein
MRIWATVVGSCIVSAAFLLSSEAAAQTAVPPIVERDRNWETVSNVFLALGTSSVFLMPRVYYNDPEATVGWKGRWHVSIFAPAMTMMAVTAFTEIPIKQGIESARPGCSVEQTIVRFPGSNCETFGGPSTHAFASWGATGAGTGIFLVDTFKYSDGRFNFPAFLGNVAFPLLSSIFVSIGRGVDIDNDANTEGLVNPITLQPFEDAGQVTAGALSGFFTGLTLGFTYAMLQKPSCPYGNSLFCW